MKKNQIKKIINFCRKNRISFSYDYESDILMFYQKGFSINKPLTDYYNKGLLLLDREYFEGPESKAMSIIDWIKKTLENQEERERIIAKFFVEGKEYE